jgi:hypothetical protein
MDSNLNFFNLSTNMNLSVWKLKLIADMYKGFAYSKFIWSQLFSTCIKTYP